MKCFITFTNGISLTDNTNSRVITSQLHEKKTECSFCILTNISLHANFEILVLLFTKSYIALKWIVIFFITFYVYMLLHKLWMSVLFVSMMTIHSNCKPWETKVFRVDLDMELEMEWAVMNCMVQTPMWLLSLTCLILPQSVSAGKKKLIKEKQRVFKSELPWWWKKIEFITQCIHCNQLERIFIYPIHFSEKLFVPFAALLFNRKLKFCWTPVHFCSPTNQIVGQRRERIIESKALFGFLLYLSYTIFEKKISHA